MIVKPDMYIDLSSMNRHKTEAELREWKRKKTTDARPIAIATAEKAVRTAGIKSNAGVRGATTARRAAAEWSSDKSAEEELRTNGKEGGATRPQGREGKLEERKRESTK